MSVAMMTSGLPSSDFAPASIVRTRPAFEKLLIGPLMVFGEAITGGHYLEVLRLGKQMAPGKAPSYLGLHRSFVSETGFSGAFYRGFYPWGLLQCVKGIPVLFVQNESMYQLQARAGFSESSAEKASGFLGGASIALFVNPMQKVKVTVVACETMNALTPVQAVRTITRQNGVTSLYDGVFAMMVRRSLDWGIRWTVSSEAKKYVIEQKRACNESEALSLAELVGCGVLGGAASAITHPLDNVITNSQKPLPSGAKRDLLSVARRMFHESGAKAFTRGWEIKVVDSSYHMMWMYGIGTVVYDQMRKSMEEEA